MRTFAIVTAVILLALPVSEAIAGEAARQRAAQHGRKAAAELLKQEAAFWKAFNIEMEQVDRDLKLGFRSNRSVTRGGS